MAGFKEQQFRIDGTKHPDVGEETQAPSVNVTPYKPTPAYTQEGGSGQALQVLGDSLGAFFNGLGQTAKQISDVNAYAERGGIERENDNLKLQGAVDYRAGRPMAPEYSNRQAYAGAYQTAAAENHAFELAEGFKDVLNKLPRDGSQDPMVAAQDYWKRQIGAGTGDRDYDYRLMGLFTQQVHSMVSQADEQKRQDQERVATDAIIQNASNRLQQQNGMTVGDAADIRGQVLTVTRGDPVAADKLLEAVAGTVQNQKQGLSFLNALGQLQVGQDGEGRPITWAQQNSAAYERMSEKVLKQVTQVKSVEAYNEVARWTQDATALKTNPAATAADWAALRTRAIDIDFRHGVGADKFSSFWADMSAWAKHQAGVNNMYNALTGATGGLHRLDLYEAESGRQTTDAMTNQAYAMIAQNTPGMEELAASTRQSNGLVVDPHYSDKAMRQFIALIASEQSIEAHQGKVTTNDMKAAAFGPITGVDPVKAARAYSGIRFFEQQRGYIPSGMLSADQEQMYQSMRAYTYDGTDPVTAFKAMHDDPRFQQFMAKGQKSGEWNIADLAGKRGAEAQKLQESLEKGLVDLARTNNDLTTIPFFRKDVGMSPSLKADYYGLLAKDALIQLSNGSSYDPKKAVENVAATMAGRSLVLPAMNGNLRMIENPFGDQGKTMGTPLNATGPLSVNKGFDPFYSGVPMTNALGQRENPQATFAKDLEALAKAFPSMNAGKGMDTKGVYLADPDTQGLMMLKQRNGQPIQFAPGQTVDLPVNVTRRDWLNGGTKEVLASRQITIPSDPQEAAKFLHDHLPPGWYPVQNGYAPPGGTPWFTLNYGFRLLGKTEALEKQSMLAEFQRDADNAATNRRLELKQGYTTEGGAAMGITPSQRGRPAAADSDPLSRIGQRLSDTAASVSKRYGEVYDAQVDLLRNPPGWLRDDWARRKANVLGVFGPSKD
ncbi:hypothetical protein [uncultured Pseudacidovorax sp.]|uniref:hypothetical protein n=1 Tax=uncultured Pseudacidovorax sp. TaxID=679313 RepID=UPI0025F90C45|nr:hypothetical protein [uncultured Pseudacidovorax sp.]